MWTCPACAATVEETFDVCWSCGTSRDGEADPTFVRADDAGPIADPIVDGFPGLDALGTADAPGSHDALVQAYRARDLMEAQFLADQLGDAGFPAKADEQDMHDQLGGMTSGPRVYVRAADLAGARAWLADYDRNKSVSTDAD